MSFQTILSISSHPPKLFLRNPRLNMVPKLFAFALTLSATFASPLVPRATCYDYVLIDARGTFELQGPSLGFGGMIKQTKAALPNGNVHDVIYPAAPDLTQLTTLVGRNDILSKLRTRSQHCPNQTYALLGYSQGATVVLEALKSIKGTSVEALVKAVLLIGNPTQVPNQVSTVDEDGGSSTRGSSGSLLFINGEVGLSQEWVDSGNALNICVRGDPVCNGLDITSLATWVIHLSYPLSAKVQDLGAEFLISQLQ
ncbi:cutinase [Aspergillus pseudoustus]|uniref:Cutinase n=1 Tax=Aspergillus pseudoustus TaxID=1810923 RepID=A0ABR4JEG6_9EURO